MTTAEGAEWGPDLDDWYCRDFFTPGEWCFDADGLFKLQYVGSVSAQAACLLVGDHREHEIDSASGTEPVMLFRVVEDGADNVMGNGATYYTHTKSDANRGYHFIRIPGPLASRSRTSDKECARRSRRPVMRLRQVAQNRPGKHSPSRLICTDQLM
jgi:hypothetical protein